MSKTNPRLDTDLERISEGKKVFQRKQMNIKGKFTKPKNSVYKGDVVKPLNPRKEAHVKPELNKGD